MSRLQSKVAVITGGTSGIGLAAAQRFVAEGAFVYIFARRQDELDKTVASIGLNIAGVPGDVRKLEDLDRLYAKVASDGRKLDVVVANVGAVDSVKLSDVTIESFNHNFDGNAPGVLFTVQKSLWQAAAPAHGKSARGGARTARHAGAAARGRRRGARRGVRGGDGVPGCWGKAVRRGERRAG